MNKVFLIGRITKDLELRKTATGKSVCKFSLAVNRMGTDSGVDYPNCVAWGNLADNLCRYQKKGNQIAVDGRIQTGSFESKGGRVYTTDVICDNVQFLTPRTNTEAQNTFGGTNTYPEQQSSSTQLYDSQNTDGIGNEDLPF